MPDLGFDHDQCLSIFGEIYQMGALVFPPHATVLEIGCAEADWMTPMLAVRPDLQVIGIDWRGSGQRPGRVIQGDVLTHDFPPASFDAVVGISSIEHIGLGHYDHDPPDPDGDRHCMERVVRWLKPGGWVYADVPHGPVFAVCGTSHRLYDETAVRARLIVPGLALRQCWYTSGQDRGIHPHPVVPPEGCLAYVAVFAVKES